MTHEAIYRSTTVALQLSVRTCSSVVAAASSAVRTVTA